jgi:NCAIR mutase (PurE)-related protein
VFRTKEEDSRVVHPTKQGHHSILTSKQCFVKLKQLVQAQAKEIAALKKKEQQRKGKEKVVVEKDPEEERAEKHTQANAENAERDPVADAEKQQQKSAHDGDKDGEPKIRKGS